MAEKLARTMTVIGDSLSMARVDDQIWASDLYPSQIMLKTGMPVYNRARRTNTTSDQCSWQSLYDDVNGTRSDFYVIQLGVCDCYPRLFRKWQHNMLSRIPAWIRNRIIAYRSNRRYEITQKCPHFFVPLPEFETCYKKLLAEIDSLPGKSRQVVLINIAYPSQENIERNYNLLSIIASYNNIIAALAEQPGRHLIDVFTASKENPGFILEDGIHISLECHAWLTEQISNKLGLVRIQEMQS